MNTLHFPYFNKLQRKKGITTQVIFANFTDLAPEFGQKVWRIKGIEFSKSRAQRVMNSLKMLPDSILMCKITVCLKSQFYNQISHLSYQEQLLSKVFRADSENPEHPERLSRSKFVFSARLLEKEDKVVTILTRSSDSINKNEAKGGSYKHTVLWVRSEFKFTSYHLDDTK